MRISYVERSKTPHSLVSQCGTVGKKVGVEVMSTRTTTIRFNEEEQKLLDLYMNFVDKPLTTVIKESLFEDIYDFFDNVLSEQMIKENKGKPSYTTAELLAELELE